MNLMLWAAVVFLLIILGAWVFAPLWRGTAGDLPSAESWRTETNASALIRGEELAMLLADLELDHRDGRLAAETYEELRREIAEVEAAALDDLEPPPVGQP